MSSDTDTKTNDTGIDAQTMENAKKIAKVMRSLPMEESKMIFVYASALHDRSMLAAGDKPGSVVG